MCLDLNVSLIAGMNFVLNHVLQSLEVTHSREDWSLKHFSRYSIHQVSVSLSVATVFGKRIHSTLTKIVGIKSCKFF